MWLKGFNVSSETILINTELNIVKRDESRFDKYSFIHSFIHSL